MESKVLIFATILGAGGLVFTMIPEEKYKKKSVLFISQQGKGLKHFFTKDNIPTYQITIDPAYAENGEDLGIEQIAFTSTLLLVSQLTLKTL